MTDHPALLVVGHGSRSAAGVAEYWELADVVRAQAPDMAVGCGFIELAAPDLDTAIDDLVAAGATSVVASPLILLGAGHLKNDGPAALHRGRHRHPRVEFQYARDLGIHPLVLAVAQDRMGEALGDSDPATTAVVVVGRGSSDPDANADLHKVARLLWEAGGAALVEPAFVSLAPPDVPAALDRCRRLGATRIAVVPYFLFTGVLVERIREQTSAWGRVHPDIDVRHGPHLGADARIATLLLDRYREALGGEARMNCDLCVYRTAMPGHEHRVGLLAGGGHDHAGSVGASGGSPRPRLSPDPERG
jgi:cobalt/nickel transport system ATP-binding protein